MLRFLFERIHIYLCFYGLICGCIYKNPIDKLPKGEVCIQPSFGSLFAVKLRSLFGLRLIFKYYHLFDPLLSLLAVTRHGRQPADFCPVRPARISRVSVSSEQQDHNGFRECFWIHTQNKGDLPQVRSSFHFYTLEFFLLYPLYNCLLFRKYLNL